MNYSKLFLALVLTCSGYGCAVLDLRSTDRQSIADSRGYVIGHKELLLDRASGEKVARVVLYTPYKDSRGEVIWFEESSQGGAILRDVAGKPIGNRYVDLRSRGSNPGNRGLTIVFLPKKAERTAVAMPSIEELDKLISLQN